MSLPRRAIRFPGIEGLPLILVASNALVYVFELLNPGISGALALSPAHVRAGEVWRLLTFLFVPPAMSVFFMFFWLYLFYIYAAALEEQWGSSRFTLFYLVGALATAAVGLAPAPGYVSNAYLNASLFLAFATLHPNFEILIFFILPVKVKYLGYFTWAWMAWSFLGGGTLGRLAVAAAAGNFLIFFWKDIVDNLRLKFRRF
ncbi:MAG: hypothetical protein ACT4O3_09690 [Elusimicrobiota bacterium]